MGYLGYFCNAEFVSLYQIENFIETGTNLGNSIEVALNSGIKNCYSCDIDPTCYNHSMKKFEGKDNVHIYLTNSFEFLNNVIDNIKGNTLFWLDAHFSPFSKNQYDPFHFPLVQEIKIVAKRHNICNDLIICDDIRVIKDENNPGYVKSVWDNLPDWAKIDNCLFSDCVSPLSQTHDYQVFLDNEFYLLFTPRKLQVG